MEQRVHILSKPRMGLGCHMVGLAEGRRQKTRLTGLGSHGKETCMGALRPRVGTLLLLNLAAHQNHLWEPRSHSELLAMLALVCP